MDTKPKNCQNGTGRCKDKDNTDSKDSRYIHM